ncbi:MAG TPA: adenylate/guanylate cyclase domain-containing protein [Anaerolineales bacterium]|nr:adenylate/guanylate cyclase domain-containing protein [Anaerolineales bacterium]
MSNCRGHILVVDDHATTRLKLSLGLHQQGHTVGEAENGRQALEKLRADAFDLVLLDILMPEMDGYQVLEQMKADTRLRDLPVIVISAQDELESVVRGIELGADDYLPKTFDPVLLKARIGACLEKKHLRDIEQRYLEEIRRERERSERLLLNILPASVAERLKQGETVADSFDQVSILFADIAGFTQFSAGKTPARVVEVLNQVFSAFDRLTEEHGLEKIKTIGDAYMVAAGLPEPRSDHAEVLARMALDMQAAMHTLRETSHVDLELRIGMNTGPAVAGIIGFKKFAYDLWGDTINVASRMETAGVPGKIQVSERVYELLKDKFVFQDRGLVDIRGKGAMRTFFLEAAAVPSA